MSLAGYVIGWAQEYARGIEYAAERGYAAIDEYLFDMDADWVFRHNGEDFHGAQVHLCPSPKVEYDSATGVIRARDASAKQCAIASVRISDAAREQLSEYFKGLFEHIWSIGGFPL